MRVKKFATLFIAALLLSSCSEVQKVIDTGKQVVDTAQGLSNVCSIAEETWTTEVNPEDATRILKRAIKELEGVASANENLIPESKTLFRDLQTAIDELEKGLTKKELKDLVTSIQSLCSNISTQ
jgi:PBP1b-binding outer membrane lipoprotein LpoB